MGLEPLPTGLGVGLAIIGNAVWEKVTNNSDPVPLIEHQHVGLASLILASRSRGTLKSVGTGFGTALIVQKAVMPDPFNQADGPVAFTFNVGLTSVLGGILLLSVSSR